MSNLEWMQLRHYEKWQKRLQEDPYKTLFGASNDMLSGKGLNNWDWVHNSFPKWMLRDMGIDDQPQEASKEKPAETRYPKRVDVVGNDHTVTKARDTRFSRSSFRREPFEREGSAGVASPSDLRRPQEGPHVRVVGKVSNDPIDKGLAASTEAHYASPLETARSTIRDRSENGDVKETVTKTPQYIPDVALNSTPKMAPEELASIQAFKQKVERLNNSPVKDETVAQEAILALNGTSSQLPTSEVAEAESKSWRQTALQRHTPSELITKPEGYSEAKVKAGHLENDKSPTEDVVPIRSPPNSEKYSDGQPFKASKKERDWLLQQEQSIPDRVASAHDDVSSARSASQILNQLPKDDIDFLNAADIRASMGSRRSRIPNDAQRQAERQTLEKAFQEAHDTPEIDSMLEAAIKNNQFVRRTEREMRNAKAAQEAEKISAVTEQTLQNPTTEVPVESSIDRMKRWLETTGASFAKQFWQDPTEQADITKTRVFFDKVAHYLRKGKFATRQITEDLEKDLPASKMLLKRLKSDEDLLDTAIHRLRQRYASGNSHGLTPGRIRAMESLKIRFHQTNNELEKAYEALREITGTEAVTNATGSFKRRLTAASKVLHKNAQLLRMLVWSIQTRLEDPTIDRNILSNYKVVADNLLSLRDTQMTLIRLVDRAMSTYGVVTNVKESIDTTDADQSAIANCEDPFVRARLALDAHLINEIKAHNTTVQEISNDSGSCASEPTMTSTLNEPNLLAHSLFRPFGPAIEKLGSKDVLDHAAEKGNDSTRRALSDLKLVDETKRAYEDRKSVNRSQTTSGSEVGEMQRENRVTQNEMSKDALLATGSKTECLNLENPDVSEHDRATRDTESFNVRIPPDSGTEALSRTSTEASASDQSVTATTSAEKTSATSIASSSTAHLQTHYTILIRDPSTDIMSMTTSSTGPPRDNSPAMPLHQALAALDSPASFVPHIGTGLEVVSANKDMLVLRDALDSGVSTRSFETIHTSKLDIPEESVRFSRESVNPIDGTARLSPTGYVGPEESPEQLEKEFQERRQAAGRFKGGQKHIAHERTFPELERLSVMDKKEKKRGRAGSVVRTAIWVAGLCYVVGVIGEIATAPFG
jgi:hypothetical protein